MSEEENMENTLSKVLEVRLHRRLDTSCDHLYGLLMAAKKGGISILSNEVMKPIGYIACAYVNRDTLWMVQNLRQYPGYHYEWAEGNICLIYDVVFLSDYRKQARKKMLNILNKKRAVAFMRRSRFSLFVKPGCSYKKILSVCQIIK